MHVCGVAYFVHANKIDSATWVECCLSESASEWKLILLYQYSKISSGVQVPRNSIRWSLMKLERRGPPTCKNGGTDSENGKLKLVTVG